MYQKRHADAVLRYKLEIGHICDKTTNEKSESSKKIEPFGTNTNKDLIEHGNSYWILQCFK